MASSSRSHIPQDIVSIFHCSFHPTKGNIIDWSLKTREDLDLTNVEFSSLPSGLHLVEQDVVYFTKGEHQGVSVFRRRKTSEQGQRGFRLTAFGVLLAKSARPRPWKHVKGLHTLVNNMYAKLHEREPEDKDWEAARLFFEERKVVHENLGGAGDWKGWSDELDGPDADLANPTTHLPHLLRILGLSTMTLYKHILGRRRILIYTLPPVEAACILCQVAADMCYDAQADYECSSADGPSSIPIGGDNGAQTRLKGRCRQSVKVMGMVTLNDLDMLREESKSGRGWIACTTDAIFLEKPQYYDLVIDLTSCTPSKSSRPNLFLSTPVEQNKGRGSTHKLTPVRFTWSDVKLWGELERLLQKGSDACTDSCCTPPPPSAQPKNSQQSSGWDVWRIYEDVCIICAGLWMGTWRSNSLRSYSTRDGNMANWGKVRLEGDDDLSIAGTAAATDAYGSYVRNVGMGIEGRPPENENGSTSVSSKAAKRSSGMSIWSKLNGAGKNGEEAQAQVVAVEEQDDPVKSSNNTSMASGQSEQHERQVLTTLALLQTFHAHTVYILSRLSNFLPHPPSPPSPPAASTKLDTITLSPKDILSFELGPFSSLDARFIEWLGDEYGWQRRVKIVVKRGWKDLVGLVFGFG